MALEDIFRALEEQAQEECDQVLADAREQAAAIAADAVEEADALTARIVAEVGRTARQRATQSLNAARLEGKKRVASVKARAVVAAFDRSLEALGSVRGSGMYPAIFKALAQEALEGFEGELCVHCDPADEGLARETLSALGVRAAIEPVISTRGGLVVTTRAGRIMRRNTLEDRLGKVRLAAQAEVAEILFS